MLALHAEEGKGSTETSRTQSHIYSQGPMHSGSHSDAHINVHSPVLTPSLGPEGWFAKADTFIFGNQLFYLVLFKI